MTEIIIVHRFYLPGVIDSTTAYRADVRWDESASMWMVVPRDRLSTGAYPLSVLMMDLQPQHHYEIHRDGGAAALAADLPGFIEDDAVVMISTSTSHEIRIAAMDGGRPTIGEPCCVTVRDWGKVDGAVVYVLDHCTVAGIREIRDRVEAQVYDNSINPARRWA